MTTKAEYSRFWLSDLHVHTAADANHRYGADAGGREPNEEFASRLVAAFASAGVRVLAITDHNRVDWWPVMRDEGRSKGVHVFPGIEISVNRCHLIGIWEADTPGYELAKRFAQSIHRPGTSPYVNGAPRPVSQGNVSDNARSIVEHQGLVLAPHSTHSKLGLFGPGVCTNANEVAQSGLVAAFDVYGNPGADVLQNPSSRFDDVLPRWILTGDTRSFDDAGARALYLKMGRKPTLEGLRQAFVSPATRVRFRERDRAKWGRVKAVEFARSVEPTWSRMQQLKVQGGFHDGLNIGFAPGLNAIIGGKGTGKSAIIEIIRYLTETHEPDDKALVQNRLQNFPANADASLSFAVPMERLMRFVGVVDQRLRNSSMPAWKVPSM